MNWTSVDDGLPEAGKLVILVVAGSAKPGWLRDLKYQRNPEKCGKWQTYHGVINNGVTHWMPLPELPEAK